MHSKCFLYNIYFYIQYIFYIIYKNIFYINDVLALKYKKHIHFFYKQYIILYVMSIVVIKKKKHAHYLRIKCFMIFKNHIHSSINNILCYLKNRNIEYIENKYTCLFFLKSTYYKTKHLSLKKELICITLKLNITINGSIPNIMIHN